MESQKEACETSTVSSKRPTLQWEARQVMGPASETKAYWGKYTLYCLRARWFLGWEQITLTIPDWLWFPLIQCLAIRLPSGAHQLLELKATNEAPKMLLDMSSEGNSHSLCLSFFCYIEYLPQVCPRSSPNITATLRVLRPTRRTGRRKEESAKRERILFLFCFNENFLLVGQPVYKGNSLSLSQIFNETNIIIDHLRKMRKNYAPGPERRLLLQAMEGIIQSILDVSPWVTDDGAEFQKCGRRRSPPAYLGWRRRAREHGRRWSKSLL